MIAKQFLITGIIMAVIAMILSILFRIQLAWPDKSFPILETFLGKWAEGGRIKPDFYLALVTIHGTIMVFFVLTAGLSGTFSNLLIPLQLGARDMASPFLNMLSYWFFFVACVIMMASFFVQTGPASAGWTVYPPLSALPKAMPGSGMGMTLWLISMVLFVASSVNGWYQLCKYCIKHAYKRYGSVENAFNYLGFLLNSYSWCIIIPCIGCRCGIIDF